MSERLFVMLPEKDYYLLDDGDGLKPVNTGCAFFSGKGLSIIMRHLCLHPGDYVTVNENDTGNPGNTDWFYELCAITRQDAPGQSFTPLRYSDSLTKPNVFKNDIYFKIEGRGLYKEELVFKKGEEYYNPERNCFIQPYKKTYMHKSAPTSSLSVFTPPESGGMRLFSDAKSLTK